MTNVSARGNEGNSTTVFQLSHWPLAIRSLSPFRAFACFLLAACCFVANGAELTFLKSGKPDPTTLLAPPPLMGSPEQDADMQEVKAIFSSAPEADKKAARAEKGFTVLNFAPAIGPWFASNNIPRTVEFFEQVQLDADEVTGIGKKYFKRPRPYTTDPSLANGKLESSFSYPSGHSTESMVIALVLAELFPEQQDAIIAQARSIGWHRVEIARHYPTDIYAGRVLAQAIVREMDKDSDFRKALEDARKEVAGARQLAKTAN
jgi:acid phosphatase (class A)